MTLHEAILSILKKHYVPLSVNQIADELNKTKIYQRSDGALIPSTQISLRIKRYPQLFEKNEKGFISYKVDNVRDLLMLASEFQNDLRKIIADSTYKYKSSFQLVPFLFFFKRILDNPETTKKFLSFPLINTHSIKKDLFSFIISLDKQEKFHSYFSIHNILNELELPFIDYFLDNNLKRIAELNLANNIVSNNEFGEFFNELIYITCKQNSRLGQFISPKPIANLFYELCKNDIKNDTKIYNPGAGFSSIPSLFAQLSKMNFQFYGEEVDSEIYFHSVMNLISSNINPENFFNSNSFFDINNDKEFDLAICIPPFGTKINELPIDFHPYTNTKDISLLFIQLILSRLKSEGKAIILVTENILFNKGISYLNFRKYLIKNRLIESVISLPSDILQPFSGIKTSVLILSKKNNTQTLFIDGENPDFYTITENGKSIFDPSKIALVFNNEFLEINELREPDSYYGNKKTNLVNQNLINEHNHDLSVRRYLLADLEDDTNSNIENTNKLSDVLKLYKRETNKRKDVQFVNVSDLNNKYFDFYLEEKSLPVIKENQKGKIVNSSVLLIGSIPPNIKPSFFKYSNKPICISSNIYAFEVDTTKIDIEYLIFTLSKNEVKDKLWAISAGGTSLKRFSANDFLNLKIELPPLEKQKEIIKIAKETIYNERISEANNYAEKIGITAKSEKEILGFVKHEIDNIVPGINQGIKTLESFIKNKDINFEEQISERKNSKTIKSIFELIYSNIDDVEHLMNNIKNIIEFGNSETQKSVVKFRKYIQAECEKLSNKINPQYTKIFIGIKDNYFPKEDIDFLIDKNQFSVVIRNFILNSLKHGYVDESDKKNIIFNLHVYKDFYYLNMINDGKPFVSEFSFQDFISFGGKFGDNKGSGLGGYLMNKVIENHSGTMELIDENKTIYINKFDNKPDRSIDYIIKNGVHFMIKIPR